MPNIAKAPFVQSYGLMDHYPIKIMQMHNNAKAPFVQFSPYTTYGTITASKIRNNKNGTALKWRAVTVPSKHDALLHQGVNQQRRRGG